MCVWVHLEGVGGDGLPHGQGQAREGQRGNRRAGRQRHVILLDLQTAKDGVENEAFWIFFISS